MQTRTENESGYCVVAAVIVIASVKPDFLGIATMVYADRALYVLFYIVTIACV